MQNSTLILWIPIIVIAILSIVKLIKKREGSGKSWIRIEEIDKDE